MLAPNRLAEKVSVLLFEVLLFSMIVPAIPVLWLARLPTVSVCATAAAPLN